MALNKIGGSLKKRVSRRVMNLPIEAISQVQRNFKQIRKMPFVYMKDDEQSYHVCFFALTNAEIVGRRQRGIPGEQNWMKLYYSTNYV